MAVNFYGPVYATQAALPHMKGLGDSRILVTSSVAGSRDLRLILISINVLMYFLGLVGAPGRCGYSASKFAVNGAHFLPLLALPVGLTVSLFLLPFTFQVSLRLCTSSSRTSMAYRSLLSPPAS